MGVDVCRDWLNASRRSTTDDRDRCCWGHGHLVAETGHHADVTGILTRPPFFGELDRSRIGTLPDVLEHLLVPDFRHGAFQRHIHCLQEGVETHQAETDRTLTLRGVDSAGHFRRRALDEVFKHIVEEAEDVFDEGLILGPFEILLGIDRRQAAHSGAVLACMVDTGWQGNFGAEIGLCDLQAKLALVSRHGVVHGVGEQQVWLTSLHAQLKNFLPQFTSIDRPDNFLRLRTDQAVILVIFHRFHEVVGDVDTVMQIQGFPVEVAGRLADFEKLFDFRVVDINVTRGRATAQRTLADRQRQRIHDTNERDDSGGLTVLTNLLANRADIAPIGSDAAAI